MGMAGPPRTPQIEGENEMASQDDQKFMENSIEQIDNFLQKIDLTNISFLNRT